MSVTLESSVFMGKNYSDNWHSIINTKDLTMKQMFDISEKLVSEQLDEIYGVKTINWENSSWKDLSLIGDEEFINLQHTKILRILRFCLVSWKDERNPQSNIAWENRVDVVQKFTEYFMTEDTEEFSVHRFSGLS